MCQLLFELRASQCPTPDMRYCPIAIDQDAARNRRCRILLGNIEVFVQQENPAEPALGDEFLYQFLRFTLIDTEYLESVILMLAIDRFHVRHFNTTWRTPRGPEIDQDHFSSMIG